MGLHERTVLGDDGHGLGLVAAVVDHDARKIALGVAGADIDRDIVGDRVERALEQQHRRDLVADSELQVLERAVRRRQEKHGHRHQHQHAGDAREKCRTRQRDLADAGRAQHDHFAFADQPVVGEQHRDEDCDGQHGVDEAGQDQQREIKEQAQRQAAIDDQVDETQRFHQPDRGGENQRNHQRGAERLAQDIARQLGHESIIRGRVATQQGEVCRKPPARD